MDTVEHPTKGRVVLRYNHNATRHDLILATARLFGDMGCTCPSHEIWRLSHDKAYFDTWVLDLPDWCPHEAMYLHGDEVVDTADPPGE